MSDKVNEAVDKNAELVGQKDPVVYEYGDFTIKCSCGHEEVLEANIQGGLQFTVFTTDTHNLRLKCSECGHELELFFAPAANPPQPEPAELLIENEEIKDEPVPETDKTEE